MRRKKSFLGMHLDEFSRRRLILNRAWNCSKAQRAFVPVLATRQGDEEEGGKAFCLRIDREIVSSFRLLARSRFLGTKKQGDYAPRGCRVAITPALTSQWCRASLAKGRRVGLSVERPFAWLRREGGTRLIRPTVEIMRNFAVDNCDDDNDDDDVLRRKRSARSSPFSCHMEGEKCWHGVFLLPHCLP